jgi:hypothetical protein
MNRERRAVLRGAAALTVGSGVVGTGRAVGDGHAGDDGSGRTDRQTEASERTDASSSSGPERRASRVQQFDTALPPGVTLFDLNGDGEFTATVEDASEERRDDAHPRPIHVTSTGRSTVDFAASIVEPAQTTLGGLERLTYDYLEGADNGGRGGSEGVAPDQTFAVVENADGRHGTYLSYDADSPAGEWATFDVLARLTGDTEGTSRWFEYTAVEEGYDGRTFDDAVARFGEDARLVRIGVGHGNAVEPTTLDVYYDNLVVNETTERFPVEVANRVAHSAPF